MFWVVLSSCAIGVASETKKKPHIVFSVIDDLGWNDVGWQDGFGQIQTPKLEALLNESIKLDQYYVYRFCSPSRSTFLTGRYPWHIGQQTHMNLNPTPGIACGINKDYDFVPKMLQKAGYKSAALGKWHLGYLTNAYTPTFRGFDTYLGYYSGAEEHFTHLKGGAWKGSNFYDLANNTGSDVRSCLSAVGNASSTYSSYLYGNETLRLLDAHDPSVPFYAYLAWNNVHAPNEAPDEYIAMHGDIKDDARMKLSAMMSALDDGIVAIIDKLKEKKMWDDTVFIVTTDNGGNLGGSGINYPLRGGKYTFWQGGVRAVGFVAGGDNFIPAARRGTVWDGQMHAADWYSTIAALAGVSTEDTGPLPTDGIDIWAGLVSGGASPRQEVVLQIVSDHSGNNIEAPEEDYCTGSWDTPHCERPTTPPTYVRGKGAGSSLTGGVLIQGQWKLHYGYPGWKDSWDGWIEPPTAANDWLGKKLAASTPQDSSLCTAMPCLFDIFADPTEHNDVAQDHPDIVATMVERLQELAHGEVTVQDSGLCPTAMGSKKDPGCLAKAQATGFWEPWLEEPLPPLIGRQSLDLAPISLV